ncbi:MAG: bifunctional methylenetetrahydrofolate dehydrogenase/methenyltetrahydrofolate cyclohydrolase FolD [Lachnospiraceae bacterium]
MSQLIDGKTIASQIKEELKERVFKMKEQGKSVCLAVIQVGNDPASSIYVRNKKKACEYIGIESMVYQLPEETTQDELLKKIEVLNFDETVDGILVQSPLPRHINELDIVKAISVYKDVDGMHPESLGNLCSGVKGFLSCTPLGIIELLKRYQIPIAEKECVVIGRSNMVGKPIALLLLRENATVTIAHSATKNLKEVCKRADILVVAIGRPQYITSEYIKKGAVVIDVGMNRDANQKLCGDVDFEDVVDKTSAITPVPGGVGPMTIAMLMFNCIEAACK